MCTLYCTVLYTSLHTSNTCTYTCVHCIVLYCTSLHTSNTCTCTYTCISHSDAYSFDEYFEVSTFQLVEILPHLVPFLVQLFSLQPKKKSKIVNIGT